MTKTVLDNISTSQIAEEHFQLSLIINNSEEFLLLINRDYQIIICNHIVQKMARQRLSTDLKPGDDFFSLVSAEEKERVKAFCDRAFEGEKVEFEYAVNLEQNNTLHFHCIYKPSIDSNGKITAVVVIANDVTEKKKAYETIMHNEQRWRFALEGSNQGVWDWKIETNEVYFSPSWRKMFGYREAEGINSMSEWEKLIHPDDRKEMQEHIKKHLGSDNAQYEAEFRFKTGDGSYKWILSRGMIINRSHDGHPSRMIGTHKDISERKKTEKNYKLLFYNNPMPMWTFDRKTLRFLDVNNAAINHYGYSREEFLQMTILDIKPESEQEKVKKLLGEKQLGSDQTVWLHQKKNKEIIKVKLVVQLFETDIEEHSLVIAEDITDKLAAEADLKTSETHYRNLFQSNPLPSFIYDLATLRFLEINDAAIKHFGFSQNWFLQHSVLDIHLPEHHEALLASIKKHRSLGLARIPDWKFINNKGEQFIADISASSLEYNGAAARLVVVNDITDMVQTQAQLKDSNERFQLVSKATSDVIWDWDLVKNELKWSEGLFDLFGWTEEEISISNWTNYIHEDDRDKIIRSLENHLNNSPLTLWKEEYLFRRADGSYSHIFHRGYPIRNNEGIVTRFIGAMQDITQIKLKQKELALSNERFEFIAQATSDIIWDLNLKTNEVYLSENYQKIFGWELSENHILPVEVGFERIHPEDLGGIMTRLKATVANPQQSILEEEFRYLKADGSYAYVIDRGFISRDENGVAFRMVGTLQDISERKYQEEWQAVELSVFEVSAVPAIRFNAVLNTLISGYEKLHPEIQASIGLFGLGDEMEIVATKLTEEHRRQLQNFLEKQKNELPFQQELQNNIIISTADNEDWLQGTATTNFYDWKTSWSIPVYEHRGHLLAFITVFVNQARSPSSLEQNTLVRMRNLLRILMVNHLSREQIRISNERYDNMLKATHDLIWDWNLETGNFYRNKEGLKKVYGIEDETSIQNVYSWMERIHPADHIKVQRVINNILHASDEDTFDVEYRFKRDDGEYAFIYDRGVTVRNNVGKPLRMIGAAQNITDRKKLEQELLQQELDKQKFISQATIDTQEQERREIGKELHDNVNQVLTTTKLYLELSLTNPDLKDELIQKSSKNVIYVINEIRQLSRSLMDPSIGDLGLVDSINDLIENINITRKLHICLSAAPDLEQYLDESQKLMVFRVIQEAMNNIIKYAQATSVQLSIQIIENNLELIIADDGKGFNIETVKKGAGLKNIQNRVYLTGGTLLIKSEENKGCKIIINFPITNKFKI